jgi:hypothetical protein
MRSSPRLTNVFYAFKGSSAREKTGERDSDDEGQLGSAHEAQLEDNVTKALVNTLVHAERSVLERFLALAGVPALPRSEPTGATEPRHIHFAMQRSITGDDPVLARARRVILGIVPHGQVRKRAPAGSRPASTNERRPDAWIWGSDFAILIEAKVGGALDAEQWRDHSECLRTSCPEPVSEQELSWKDIHEALSPLLADAALSEKSRWLLYQFLEYLSLEGLMGFTGITKEVFDYFFEPGDEDTRVAVKRTIKSFADELQTPVERINPWYSRPTVGKLKRTDDHCWFAFGPQTTFKHFAHVTVSVTSGGVEVFINIELKSAMDRLRKALAAQRPLLLERMRALRSAGSAPTAIGPDRFEIRFADREQIQGSDYRDIPVATTSLDYLFDERVGEATRANLFRSIGAIRLPYIAILTTISRKDVGAAQRSGPTGIVARVARIVAQLDPIVRLINEQS